MKITINCSEDEANLIARALELYSRVGMCQFTHLTDNHSLQKLLWDKMELAPNIQDEFRRKAEQLSNICTGHTGGGNYGIFHEKVGEDCKIAANLYQTIRHEFWKHRGDTKWSQDAHPADICRMANITEPNFKLEIE